MSILGLFACFPFLNNNVVFVIVETEVSNLISLFPVTDIRIMARTFLFGYITNRKKFASALTA